MPGYIAIETRYIEDAGQVVAICDALDLAASGPTHAKADEQLSQTINAVLAAARKEGVLDDYLKSRNVTVHYSTQTFLSRHGTSTDDAALAVAPVG